MPNYNLNLKEDRDNLVKELKDCQHNFVSERNRIKSMEELSLMLETWELVSGELVSEDLWKRGDWQYYDYVSCGHIVLQCTTIVQGDVLNKIGWNYMENEDFPRATSYFKEAIKLFQDINYLEGKCESLRYLGVAYHRQKYFGSALKSYRQVLNILQVESQSISKDDIIKQQVYEAQAAETHKLLGNLYFKLYNFHASFNELTLSLHKYRSLGDEYVYYQAAPLLNLGRWYFIQGNHREAKQYYEECLRISENINRIDTQVVVLERLAELATAEGNGEKAQELTEKALRIVEEIRKQSDKGANFQEEITNEVSVNRSTISEKILTILLQIKILINAGFDLAFYAPLTCVVFIKNCFIRLIKFVIFKIHIFLHTN